MDRLFPAENSIQEMGVLRCLFQSTMDLVSGHIISRTSEAIFSHAWADVWLSVENTKLKEVLVKKAARVFLQMAFTVIMSYEVRNLYANTSGLVDPLGGLMFIAGVSQQPKFWERMNDLSRSVYQLLVETNVPVNSVTEEK